VEGAQDVQPTGQGGDELPVLGRDSLAETTFGGALQGGGSRDEMAYIAHGRLLLNGRLFSAKRKLPPPFLCRNARGAGFDVRTRKAAMSQMRVSAAWVVQAIKDSPKSTISYRTPHTGCACWLVTVAAARMRDPLQEAPMAKEPTVHKDIVSLSFEDALKELEGIVQQLERGQVKLDEAIAAYERGALLKRHCEQKLAEAKMKVEKIVFASDGSVGTQPADLG
jgi:exodeoxyribonuclease VII small subunit